MLERYLTWIGWIVIVTLAVWLRLYDLKNRPIHADEATGARILAQRLEGHNYSFDPKHFHGPLPSAITSGIARTRGEESWKELSLYTLRFGSVIAGTLTVLAPLLWLRRYGSVRTLAAAALLCSSPLIVYYNRMYIHESWLLLFGILALASLHRLALKPGWISASLAGLSIGLMFATKETFAISIIAWTTAGACLLIKYKQQHQRFYLAPVTFSAFVAFTIASYFYSDGFREWQGIADSLLTYFQYTTSPGHEKTAAYYLQLLLWPKYAAGAWWSELAVALLALLALLQGFLFRSEVAPRIFLTVSILVHFSIYSWIDYKTPWLMLLPWAHVCLLAGLIVPTGKSLGPVLKTGLCLLIIGATLFQTQQSLLAIDRFANDERNPYAYSPTSRDAEGIALWLRQLQAMPGAPAIDPVAVAGKEYWPLPWYLRDFDTIGYWPEPKERLAGIPVVFSMPGQAKDCDTLLLHTHTRFPRTLRSNVPVILYLRNDLWNLWINAPAQ